MTQENKEILLKDLCGRLPYKVKILDIPADVVGDLFLVSTTGTVEYETKEGTEIQTLYNIKPYLRPLSNMTEEERKVVNNLIYNKESIWTSPIPVWVINESDIEKYIDLCNSHHLDYRGLIEKGLALEAPEGMYKTE